jgi:hypothetical protein
MGSTNRQVVMMAIALTAMACTSGSGGTAGSGTRSDPNLITREDLASVPAITAYDAVQRLRPRWLQRTGRRGVPRVVVARTQRTNVYELTRIRADDVESIRFVSGPDATTRYGTGFTGGAIEVTLRRR